MISQHHRSKIVSKVCLFLISCSEQSTAEEYMYFLPLDLDSRGLGVAHTFEVLRAKVWIL